MNLPELLVDLTTHYNALIRSAASQLRLTVSQAFHLISIPCDGIPMFKLAHKLGLDASTLTRNIQKLENLGLVKRKHDSYDKRVQKAVLTKQGLEITEKIDAIQKFFIKFLKVFTIVLHFLFFVFLMVFPIVLVHQIHQKKVRF